jgi:hypothetical protein
MKKEIKLPCINDFVSEEAYSVVGVTLNIADKVKGLKVGLTRVIYKSTFVAVIGGIYAEWEEAIVGAFLNLLIIIVCLIFFVHVKEVAHSNLVIDFASFVAISCSEYLSYVFNYESPSWYRFKCYKSPHGYSCPLSEQLR